MVIRGIASLFVKVHCELSGINTEYSMRNYFDPFYFFFLNIN
jgi:hypothetical protein